MAFRLSSPAAADVRKAEFFRALGHPARIRVLQLLRGGELTVGALQNELGLDSGGMSQHLAALRKQGLVAGRRAGTSVHYRLKDPRALELLEAARAILMAELQESQAVLDELADESRGAPPPRPESAS